MQVLGFFIVAVLGALAAIIAVAAVGLAVTVQYLVVLPADYFAAMLAILRPAAMADPGTRGAGQAPGDGARQSGPGTRDPRSAAPDPGPAARDPGPAAPDAGPRIPDLGGLDLDEPDVDGPYPDDEDAEDAGPEDPHPVVDLGALFTGRTSRTQRTGARGTRAEPPWARGYETRSGGSAPRARRTGPQPRREPQAVTITDIVVPVDGMRALLARTEHLDKEVSRPSYFYGPLLYDVWAITRISLRRFHASFLRGVDRAEGVAESVDPPIVGKILAWGMMAGLVAGSIAGSAAAMLIFLIHVTAAAIGVLLAFVMCAVLRTADRLTRFIWGVRMRCSCGATVHPYPAYKCPDCNSLHRDIRSGQRGVAVRVCRCHHRMPTSLLLGAAKRPALCPSCGNHLPSRFGKIGEIAIPFFGGVKVGKTQLMYMVTLAIRELVELGGGKVELVDDTQRRLDQIAASIAIDGSIRHTPAAEPSAYILDLKLGSFQRRVLLFDAAGELHYHGDTLGELRYLEGAHTLVFLVDPLASEAIWGRLPADAQARLSDIRSNAAEAYLAYQQTREHMRHLGARRKSTRLAFVVTKADLLDEAAEEDGWTRDSIIDLIQGSDGLDMGDTVREATQGFRNVEFFKTAATVDDTGWVHRSVEDFTVWLMKSEGITLGKR